MKYFSLFLFLNENAVVKHCTFHINYDVIFVMILLLMSYYYYVYIYNEQFRIINAV